MPGHAYFPKGVCASRITFRLKDGALHGVRFEGGCDGNAKGLARLVEGRPAREIASLLRGVQCEDKGTSCPDQLALALAEALEPPRPKK